MAPTLDVYPGTGTIPTTGEVLRLGTGKFHAHLNRLQIDLNPEGQVRAITTEGSRPVDPEEPMLWPGQPHSYL